jgi:hypothetical protein
MCRSWIAQCKLTGLRFRAVYLDGLFSFDPATMTWTRLAAAAVSQPSARSRHGFTSAGGRLYVYGGNSGSGIPFERVGGYSPTGLHNLMSYTNIEKMVLFAESMPIEFEVHKNLSSTKW